MPKYPWIQFFSGDWLKDPAISLCSPATRGVWIDFLCRMHESDRSGVITGTREQLARAGRCSAVDIDLAIEELKNTGAADVTIRNGVVTVINRRMQRESKSRNNSALRVERFREKKACNAPVTPHISEVIYHKSEGDSAREVPEFDSAFAQTAPVAIPKDFCRYVYDDWLSREGKDAGGSIVKWLPYVTKRWAREQNEWKNGTHKGKRHESSQRNTAKGNDRNAGTYNANTSNDALKSKVR